MIFIVDSYVIFNEFIIFRSNFGMSPIKLLYLGAQEELGDPPRHK